MLALSFVAPVLRSAVGGVGLAALVLLMAAPARGQFNSAVPPESHQLAIETLYSGDYRRAGRGFTGDLRGAIKTVQSRWIDSICSYTLLGETYYQQGRNGEALEQFDQACQLFLVYPDWLARVNFQQPPRASTTVARRAAVLGPSSRQVTYTELPSTHLVGQGRLDNSRQAELGGRIQPPQLWRVDVEEIVRCTALAIRRRNELLGPLAASDRLSREVVNALARGGLGQANHWSNVWIELQLGIAQMGVGQDQQALGHLSRATLLDGRFDHSLTGAALLAQADIARRVGNAPGAATLYREAAIAAFAYGDYDILGEALQRGFVHHEAPGGQGVFAPLEAALAWADRKNLNHIDWVARHALVESLVNRRQTANAAALYAGVSNRDRDLFAGRLGPNRLRLGAMIAGQQGDSDESLARLNNAIQRQAEVSLTNFQAGLASARFDSGILSPRLAVGVFGGLLVDPAPAAWVDDPLDAIAHLRTDMQGAYDRWFAASIGRRETTAALQVSDLAKRRRFYAAQPLGGRLVALRRLLESPVDGLAKPERLERQAVLAIFPEYADLSRQAAQLRGELTNAELMAEGRLSPPVAGRLKELGRLAQAREARLREIALRRLPATLGYPPTLSSSDAQKRLADGEALLVYHRSGGAMHGFVLVAGGEHYWRLPENLPSLTTKVGATLRDLGNFNAGSSLSIEQAAGGEWRAAVQQLGRLVLGGSRIDLAKTRRLTIVPDGPLWHAPFEALSLGGDGAQLLIDATPIRYAPTVGVALGDRPPPRPVTRTGLALPKPAGSPLEREVAEQQWGQLEAAIGSVVGFEPPSPIASPLLAATVDQLVVEIGSELDPLSPYDWRPAPLDRGPSAGSLRAWLTLPHAAPERLVLSGVRTAAGSGLKGGRRSGPAAANPGDEVFQAACALLGLGPRTVLLSRWSTGGATHAELIREFASQMDKRPAADAWRRSAALARDSVLDPLFEPRLEAETEGADAPLAEHPFFWSGYLLLDAGLELADDSIDEPAAQADPK